MRILMFAAVFSGVLWTQTPPPGSSGQVPATQETTPGPTSKFPSFEQKQEPSTRRFLSPSNRHMFLPPTSTVVTPSNNEALELVTIEPSIPTPSTIAPVPECAVPLINVTAASGFNGDPKIVVPGPRELVNIDHMPVVQGLPSCDQVKR
jgi:hypothetical protein